MEKNFISEWGNDRYFQLRESKLFMDYDERDVLKLTFMDDAGRDVILVLQPFKASEKPAVAFKQVAVTRGDTGEPVTLPETLEHRMYGMALQAYINLNEEFADRVPAW